MTLYNLSALGNKLRFAFNDETKQIHVVRVTPSGEEDLGAVGIEVGAGLPIPMTFADPSSNDYTAAQATSRAATHLRVIVANSGVVISLDKGTTASISLPANAMDDIPISIPLGTLIKVKRYTPGTAWTGLIMEIR